MNDMPTPAHSVATIQTALATRYMTQLCKHFEHRCPARYDATTGEISFPTGVCRLHADPATLTLSVEATDAAALPQLQDVVARHLVRFAFREEMQVNWT